VIGWDSVRVAYGGTVVLGPVTLSVDSGEWLGLIGPNGAGKSTMLKTAVGLAPHTGRVNLGERDLVIARDIAWMPQRPSLPGPMGVADYVMLGRSPHIGYLGSEGLTDRDVVAKALDALDLAEMATRPLGTLSGGEAQRAVLARALAQAAPVLLLDEPTANLDLGHAVEVLRVLDRLRRESDLTVVTAIHDLTLAGRFCQRLALLSDGLIVSDGDPRTVLSDAVLQPHYGESIRVIQDIDGPVVLPGRPRQ
jgi:iron complex transport system ATP-binding protein